MSYVFPKWSRIDKDFKKEIEELVDRCISDSLDKYFESNTKKLKPKKKEVKDDKTSK